MACGNRLLHHLHPHRLIAGLGYVSASSLGKVVGFLLAAQSRAPSGSQLTYLGFYEFIL
jgi:hypothetical protein